MDLAAITRSCVKPRSIRGVACGFRNAWRAAVNHAAKLDANAGPYLKLVAQFGTPADHEIVYAALRLPALQRYALWALGHIGTTRAAEACLSGMQHEQLARAAGEAYCWITGADLTRDHLAAQEPQTEAPAFEDDDLDANLTPTAGGPLAGARATGGASTLARPADCASLRTRATHAVSLSALTLSCRSRRNRAHAASAGSAARTRCEDKRPIRRRATRIRGASADNDGERAGRDRQQRHSLSHAAA